MNVGFLYMSNVCLLFFMEIVKSKKFRLLFSSISEVNDIDVRSELR